MKSSRSDKPHSQVLLTVKVTPNELADFWQRALDKIRRHSKVAGFRAGRAPDEVVIAHAGRATVEAEALDMAIGDTYFLALKEHAVSPVDHPKITVVKHTFAAVASDESALEYTAEVTVMPVVKIKNLAKLRVEKGDVAEPTAAEVEQVITFLRQKKAIMKELSRPAALGDFVSISYEGSVGGVKREEMKNEQHPFILGEGQLITGFEEEVVGMTIGERKTFQLRFPKDYRAKEVAGKLAEFTVQLKELKEVILPELDETLAADFGFKNPALMRQAITKNLTDEKREAAANSFKERLLEELDSRVKVELPPVMVEQETARLLSDLRKRVEEQKLPWERYLAGIKRSDRELQNELTTTAQRNIRLGLALGAIVKEQGIKIDAKHDAATAAMNWLERLATGEIKPPKK